MERDDGRKVGWHKAQKRWRLGEVGTASWIVRVEIKAGAYLEATEIVAKIADVP
jgi:hypothetical protein